MDEVTDILQSAWEDIETNSSKWYVKGSATKEASISVPIGPAEAEESKRLSLEGGYESGTTTKEGDSGLTREEVRTLQERIRTTTTFLKDKLTVTTPKKCREMPGVKIRLY